ncbi:hypothetical protein HG263_16400 [Pseudoalteromonas sp. JBTF-M23]|uniref:Nicotinate-nucleotide--dimethylbenzimidazole phosphoribosyltransferase n=1 Tax=Pseudoalteromonas caenipelagi TaxID=2726988 RepID=A0A849VFY8_9GAMM|nr:nicotinate-nucleotide--dimethylbenzimidazole phosphoribosyltransferase [Pseudoalteromonas caenipelagi]NOU52115.1 hypothetical protein [Pseudoalteromonas caenipelagi]
MMRVPPLNRQFAQQSQQIIDLKTKPLGALGQLEILAKQLATVELKLIAPQLVVFAGCTLALKQERTF